MAKKTSNAQPPDDKGKIQDKPKGGSRWKPGQSGNPAGRPKGSRNRATLAAQQILNKDAETITKKAVELAKEGDRVAMKLCLERLLPVVKDKPIAVTLPDASTAAGLKEAHNAILQLLSNGDITPLEANTLSGVLKEYRLSVESSEFDERLKALEDIISNYR